MASPEKAALPDAPEEKGSTLGQTLFALFQLLMLPILLGFIFFALRSKASWASWAAAGAAIVYVGLKFKLRRDAKRESRRPAASTESEAFQAEEISDREAYLGCLQILLLPALFVLALIAVKTNVMWLGWTAIAAFAVFVIVKVASLCRAPEPTAEGIVGGRPHDPEPVSKAVDAHVRNAGFLGPDEKLLAAVDDTWTDNGPRGVLVTDRRVVAYRKNAVRFEFALADVTALTLRRMWYPGTDYVGRGEIFGHGPVVVLRLKFALTGGATRRLRFSVYAAQLYPIVETLLARLGDRVRVRRTVPGI